MRLISLRSIRYPLSLCLAVLVCQTTAADDASLDDQLSAALETHGFPKEGLGARLQRKLGRQVDADPEQLGPKASLGRDLFFDKVLSLSNDNSCAGCHSPKHGFGDTQSIAIGVGNNDVVGEGRSGPRNQRRTPMVLNNAFYPKLMWNGRFESLSGDPFDNSKGFGFPPPEGIGDKRDQRFPAGDKHITHLLMAQAQIPSTELPEMAGFRLETDPDPSAPPPKFREPRFAGREFSILPFAQQERQMAALSRTFSVKPDVLPHGLGGFFNEPIRGVVLLRLNSVEEYRDRFEAVFPEEFAVRKFITFEMVGEAIAEFEFALTFVDAPLDRFAQGDQDAMCDDQKRGALLFFGKARCVECHAVAGNSNGMFSDFENHVLALPQIAPREQEFGGTIGNVEFSGPGTNEDFGLEDITVRETDRYKFRTSPLRNIKLQPTFGHNGAWTGESGLEAIIRHHLNPYSVRTYDPEMTGLAEDLRDNLGPIEPVLSRLSPKLAVPIHLTDDEIGDLVIFVRDGLYDPRATPELLFKFKPDREEMPSGHSLHTFE